MHTPGVPGRMVSPEKRVVHSWPGSSDKGTRAGRWSGQLEESSCGAVTPQSGQGKLSAGSGVTGELEAR